MSRNGGVGSVSNDREVCEVAQYWSASLNPMGTESLTAGVFGQTADPAWRFRFLRAALCGVPPPPGTHSQALQLLDSSSYGALVCRLLPVVALTAAATEVDVILHAILRSTQAVKYFICLMSVTPELQQASMNFLLSQVFNETVLRISVQHRRCLGVTVAVSRSSDSAARTALRCLSGRALIGRPVAESTIAAELFCIITRDVLAAEDICQALYDAVFQTSSMTSCSPAPTSCVFCSNHQGRSQWLISIAAADSIAFFLEKMSELLLAQVTVVCGNDSDHAVRTAYRDINKTCTVLAGIALCASASRKGDSIIKSQITKLITSLSNIPKDPGMLRIRESVLYFRTLRCVISLLTLVALCAFEGDQSSVAVLAIAVEIHRVTSLELYQGASDGADTFLLDEMYYSFFLRSALSLMDGRALCRVALETIYVQDDFGGFISRNRDGNYSHSCKAYEHGQGPCSPDSLIGRRVDGVIELSKSRLPSSDACRKVMRELAPGTIISVENILYTFSQLPRSHCDRGAVGDRLWCIALLLTNAPAVARNGVSTTDNCNTTESSLYHIFSHAALLDLLSCLNDNGYPHPRTARAIDSWFQFRTGRLNSKDVISNAPIPLLHREFQECVFPIMNDMTFSILNGVYSSDVHNDVNSYVVEFAISADSPREHTWAWEIAASADTAVRIVDKLIRAAFHAPNENKFKIQSNRLWRLVFALYAAMTQSCEYRYKEPITTVKLPGESTHKACPWTVHVMCESPFELIEWDGVPFRTLLQFLVHQYLCINDSASLARGIMTDIVSMALRLCPEVLLTDTVSTPQRPTKLHTKGSGCAETNISAIDKKDVLFNIFFRYGSSSFTSYTLQMGFDIVSTSVVLDLLKDVLLKAYEISSLGVLCCRNILCFSQHCDAATSKLEVETSVAQQNAFILNLDWEIIWSHIYSMHPAPLLLQLETLNCLIDADKFRLEIEMEPRRSDGTEAEIEGKIYNNMKYSTYSGLFGVELAERTFSAADIISCSRHVAPSQRSFRLFTKEPISLLRLLSAYMLVTCQFARVLLFKLVADQLLASRILARRSIWSMTAAYWLNPIGVDVQSSPGCITPWRRSEDMQAQFIDMQEVIAARLMIEISCSSAYRSGVYEHDRGATTIHQLLVRNASLLPLLMFYFDDFSSEQHAIVMMRSDRALLHQWGAQLFYVMAQQVHGLDHTDRSNGGDVRSGSPHAFLDQIIEIKRLSLGPISWSVNFLHLLFLYFVEISEDIQKEKLGHNRLCTNQCDALCSMLGAFLFKCISTFNCYHEPELFLHATSRVFEAMVTARPEMAGNPLLVMNELHSIRFLGTGVRAFSDYHRGVIENVIQGYPSHLSDITYVAKTERVYELFLIVKSILSDNLACLQQVLHEGVHGEIQDLSWSAFQKNRAAMKKRKVTDIGLEQRKRARSLDIAGDIDDCSNIGSHADSSDSGSESDNGYSSTGSSDDTEEEEPENCLGPKVAIIVPFRDLHTAQKRSEHLKRFVPEMSQFLSTRNFVIYIIEQSDDKKEFNRGALLNTGFKIAAAEDADIFIFHDVDLMPSAELLSFYTTIPTGKSPVHIARVWNRYNGNDKYFGGIVAFSKTQYEDMNGYPNNFWGWGGEDDELMKRAQELSYKPIWPTSGEITDYEEMNLEQKLKFLSEHKEWKCPNKWELLREHEANWRLNGLMNLQFRILRDTQIDGTPRSRRILVDISQQDATFIT